LKNYLHLHFIIIIWGFTAVLGKLISLPALGIVWYRLLFAVASLLLVLFIGKISLKTSARQLGVLCLMGLVVAAHWLCFYHSIKVSNASVALSAFATVVLFTGLIEPLVFGRKIHAYEVLLSICSFIGIYIIFRVEVEYAEGILWGLLAAVTNAVFIVVNGKLAVKTNAFLITFYELLMGFAGLTLFLLLGSNAGIMDFNISGSDLFYLLILGVVCTTYAFSASTWLMRFLTPFTVVITNNLEPVYGILLSVIIFGSEEVMPPGFYLGMCIILCCVFIYPILKKKYHPADIEPVKTPAP
jgi:drug/metabolite transporter (DMT)-like permease